MSRNMVSCNHDGCDTLISINNPTRVCKNHAHKVGSCLCDDCITSDQIEQEAAFEKTIVRYLEDGFGAEDIHVQTGYSLKETRIKIRQMRQDGILDGIYGGI